MQLNRHALRALRERSGLSVSALAHLAGVSQPHLSNVEVGRRQASDELICRLAGALRVPVVALLGDVPEGSAPGPGADQPHHLADDLAPSPRLPRAGSADVEHPPRVPDPPEGGAHPTKGATMTTSDLVPLGLAARPVQLPGPARPTRSRRLPLAFVGAASVAGLLAAAPPAQAETYYTSGCSVKSLSNNVWYNRSFQARIVGVIEDGTGKYIWNHYDYKYEVDPALSFGAASDERVIISNGYDSGGENPWHSPDSHATNVGYVTEPNWKGAKSWWGYTRVTFRAAFDIPGHPDPHCDVATAVV